MSKPSEQQQFAHGLKYSAYDTVTTLVLGLASTVITARVFGAEVIGAFALAALLTGSLRLVSSVREQGGLVRELTGLEPKHPEARALVWLTVAFSAGLTLVVLVPFTVLAVYLLGHVFDRPELFASFAALAAGYLIVDNTAFNLDSPLVAYRDGRSLWFARLAMATTMIVSALICAAIGVTSIGGLVACTIAASAAGLVVRIHAVSRMTGLRTDRTALRAASPRMRAVIWFGARATPLNFTETAIEYTDTAFLGAHVPLAAVGAYNRTYGLYQRAMGVPLSLSRLYFPTMSALHKKGDTAAMARVYRLSTRYLVLLLMPVATWVAVAAPGLLGIFGPGFDQASTALGILIWIVVMDALSRSAGGVLWAADRPGIVSKVSVGVAVVNVALCFALIPPYGLTGAALANAGGWFLYFVLLPQIASRELGKPFLFMFEPNFLARLVGACLILAAVETPLRDVHPALLWQVLALPPALAVGLLIFRPLHRPDIALVEQVLASAELNSPRFLAVVRAVHRRVSHGGMPPVTHQA